MVESAHNDSAGLTLKTPGLYRPLFLAWPVLLLLVGAFFILSFVYLVLANYWPGPYEDYWADMPLIDSLYNGAITFDQLIIAHNNSHRILVPRLLFMADYWFASGSNTLLVGIALLVKLGLIYFFNRQIVTHTFTLRLLLNTLVLMAVFNGALVYNTVFNINMQWDMMLLFSLLAIFYFYEHCHTGKNRILPLILAYFLLLCASLTHAGGYLCLPVFFLMALNHKKYLAAAFPVFLFTVIFYLTFFVLPISHPDGNTYENIVMNQLIGARKESLHIFRLLSIGIYKDYPQLYLYFSVYVLGLASLNAVLYKKQMHRETGIWIYLTIFMGAVIFITSAARAGHDWFADAAEPRFKVLSLFLLLILTIHCILLIQRIHNTKTANIIHGFVVANSAALMILTHYTYSLSMFGTSNNTFSTHAFMLFQGADRTQGRWLGRNILFREERDPVVHMDVIFKSHGLAYYHNKVIPADSGFLFLRPGDTLVTAPQLPSFAAQCSPNTSAVEMHSDEGIPAIFSTPVDPATHNILLSAIHRDSYFVLDAKGVITGYAYIYVDAIPGNPQTFIRGASHTGDIRYIAEISGHQPHCLYQINAATP